MYQQDRQGTLDSLRRDSFRNLLLSSLWEHM